MLGRSKPELVFMRLVIPILRYPFLVYLALLALYFAAATSSQPAWTSLTAWPALVIYLFITAEAAFYLLIFRRARRRLRDEARRLPPISRDERKILFQTCLSNIPDPDRYLRLWFLGRDTADLASGDVARFLAWAFFDLDLDTEHASPDVEQELEDYVQSVESLLGWEFPDGKTGADCLRLTVDPVNTKYRSMAWYAAIFLVDLATCLSLWRSGFRHRTAQHKIQATMRDVFPPRPHLLLSARAPTNGIELGYWHRPHTAGPGTMPIVFLHGIGVGLWAYTAFISSIPAGTGVIMPELLNISARITGPEPLTKPVFLATVQEMLRHEGWDDFVLVTHSYGSVLATHILHSPLADRVKGMTLVDPVSLCLHLPDVAFNFTRRLPRSANEWQLWYFASMDLGVAHTLGRHFFWRENIVWKEDLASRVPINCEGPGALAVRRVAVSLAERDLIVDTLSVARYLLGSQSLASSENGGLVELGGHAIESEESISGNRWTTQEGIDVLWFPGLDHAQVFDRVGDRNKVLEEVKKQCRVPI